MCRVWRAVCTVVDGEYLVGSFGRQVRLELRDVLQGLGNNSNMLKVLQK